MLRIFFPGCFFFVVHISVAQKPVEIKNFTPAQKTEWTKFVEFWKGNGRGTCIPVMETQIDSGKCTKVGFIADVYIGKDGKIKKVAVISGKTVCENKAVAKELLKCFTDALKTEPTRFKSLKDCIVKKASL